MLTTGTVPEKVKHHQRARRGLLLVSRNFSLVVLFALKEVESTLTPKSHLEFAHSVLTPTLLNLFWVAPRSTQASLHDPTSHLQGVSIVYERSPSSLRPQGEGSRKVTSCLSWTSFLHNTQFTNLRKLVCIYFAVSFSALLDSKLQPSPLFLFAFEHHHFLRFCALSQCSPFELFLVFCFLFRLSSLNTMSETKPCKFLYTNPPECDTTYGDSLGQKWDNLHLAYIASAVVLTLITIVQTVRVINGKGWKKACKFFFF